LQLQTNRAVVENRLARRALFVIIWIGGTRRKPNPRTWSFAQYPRLIAPDVPIFNALFFLFRVFKGFSKEKQS
jgi:hypothetical protein